MPLISAILALSLANSVFAQPSNPGDEIRELHYRIVNFDFAAGSDLGPEWISAEALRFKEKLLRSVSPENQDVTVEMMHKYRLTAKAFNKSVYTYALNKGNFQISMLTLRPGPMAKWLLRDFLMREKFDMDFDANDSIAHVRWSNLRMAMDLLKKRRAKTGSFKVGAEIPERIKESVQWRRGRQVEFCEWYLEN